MLLWFTFFTDFFEDNVKGYKGSGTLMTRLYKKTSNSWDTNCNWVLTYPMLNISTKDMPFLWALWYRKCPRSLPIARVDLCISHVRKRTQYPITIKGSGTLSVKMRCIESIIHGFIGRFAVSLLLMWNNCPLHSKPWLCKGQTEKACLPSHKSYILFKIL